MNVETATRSLSCLMNDHDPCRVPRKPHVKPGTIPGTGGKPCECRCHQSGGDAA